jgi:hypothetical protein
MLALAATAVMGSGINELEAQVPARREARAQEQEVQARLGMARRAPLAGVDRMGRAGMSGMALDLRVGQILDRRYTLGLSEAQVEDLVSLQSEAAALLRPMRDEMAAVRQGMRDGSLTTDQARERMGAAREGWTERRESLTTRLEATLEPRQRALLRGAAMGQRRGGQPARMRPPARPGASRGFVRPGMERRNGNGGMRRPGAPRAPRGGAGA